MKTIYNCILLFLCLSFLGCKDKKKDEATPVIEGPLTGTWVTTLVRNQYYDASGALDKEDLITEKNGDTMYFDGKGNAIGDSQFSAPVAFKYEFRNRDGKDFILMIFGSRSEEVEITTLTDTRLIHSGRHVRNTYTKNGVSKTASKSVYIVEYDKQ